jgi:DNA-binding MarR family transcriptional regulator
MLAAMGRVLRSRLRQTRFESPIQEAFFNVVVASGHLRDRVERPLAKHHLTGAQYNVLRILRGVHPEGLPRCEIAPRLLDRAPDVTRIVDRLVAADLVERMRGAEDARHSIARITRKGLAVLERLDPEMATVFQILGKRITDREAESLSRLCEKLYEEDV